ncbi:phage tail protein [Psychrobacter pygoscelis]|uniref:phage tail protein n=1 Tax=Psychrobacter pygoscelis TaxID=2488563 RepID=UPI00103B9244|nr:phage tail protein [Psychrobacter pygoscelis]
MPIKTNLVASGHSIIVLDAPISSEADANDWVEHLDFVSSKTEQKDAILIVPFTDVDEATAFAAYPAVKSCYRIVAVCYHGAVGFEPELAAGVAATIASEADPALPFNGCKLPNLPVVDGSSRLTKTRIEQALHAGIAMVDVGHDNKPEIVRLISTYQINPVTGQADDLLLDINAALILRYVRRDLRAAAAANPRRKNTAAARRNLRSLFLDRCLKMNDAEILEHVKATKDELTVVQSKLDKTAVDARIPSHWVRGMHVINTTLDVY